MWAFHNHEDIYTEPGTQAHMYRIIWLMCMVHVGEYASPIDAMASDCHNDGSLEGDASETPKKATSGPSWMSRS